MCRRLFRVRTILSLAVPAFAQIPIKHQGFDLLQPPDSALPNEQVDPVSVTVT